MHQSASPAGEEALGAFLENVVELVGYHGVGAVPYQPPLGSHCRGRWQGVIDLTPLLQRPEFRLFYPFTTTLLELRLDREPMPIEGANMVLRFL